MYVLLCGQPPFNAATDDEMREKIVSGKFSMHGGVWDSVSTQAKDLISRLLQSDPEARLTAEESLEHPWFTENEKTKTDFEQAATALRNLEGFRAEEKIKQATCAYIASQLLSKKEKDRLGSVFKQLDENGDGRLSKDELKKGYLLVFGQALDDFAVERLFDAVDLDKSGYIDYSEFVIACTSEQNLFSESKLRAAFKMFDKDDSGFISKEEIKASLRSFAILTENQVDEIINQVDENEDEEISFEEFKKVMTKSI